MGALHLNLSYSGVSTPEEDAQECVKKDVADVSLSESTCGNGNSDLYKYLLSWIAGQPLPTASSSSNFGATVWAQDQIGNGYTVDIAVGELSVEQQVTTQENELFYVSPSDTESGKIDVEALTGWTVDDIWSVSWVGYVTDENGKNTSKPTLSIREKNIELNPAAGVYGCLSIKYDLTRDKITVGNDGESGSYDTSLSFSADGCDDEEFLQLPAQDCLKDMDAASFIEEAKERLGEGDSSTEVPKEPPTDSSENTKSVYDYCSRKLISSDLPDAPEVYGRICVEGD